MNGDDKSLVSEIGEANVFAKSGMLQRSPPASSLVAVPSSSNTEGVPDVQEGQLGPGVGLLLTPTTSGSKPQDKQQGLQLGRSKSLEVKRKVDELYEFIKEKHNVHHKIRALVTDIKAGVLAAEREQKAWRLRAEKAENELKEKMAMLAEAKETVNPRSGKRDRETPGEEEVSKKQKEDKNEEKGEKGEGSGWQTVDNKAEKKSEKNNKEEKKKEEKNKEEKKKEKPRRERSRGDALVIEVKGRTTYADLLRKVRADPELKDLGENVVKTRRTQKGEMLFELKKDPAIKSSAFKTIVEKSLGEEATVRALSQETAIECRDLDEITTEGELRSALKVQGDLGDVPMTIRLRKAYGGTQTAAIRISTAAANKLLELGRVKVGWSVCPLKATPRVAKEMERCFKCMGFGHLARNCKGPDRSDLCRKCGEKGHFARDCTKQPRCMLCKNEDGNDHMTGGFKCPAYKKAIAGQQ